MDIPNAVQEEIKKECVLEPATPAKLIPPRPYFLPNVNGFTSSSNGSSDSGGAVCVNDSDDFLNLETKSKDRENFDGMPLNERDSSIDCQLSSGLPSVHITCSEDGRRAVVFDLYDNVEILGSGLSGRPVSVDTSVLKQCHVQEGQEGGKTVGGKSPKSSIKRQRVKKPIAKRYRPKIHDDRKPQKISKSKLKKNSSDTVDGIQPGKKRKYVKTSLTESAIPNIPVSETGNSPSLTPNTPGPLISEHTREPLIAEHTPEPLAYHIPKPATADHNKFHAKSCRRSLDFSMDKHVDLSQGHHENKGEESAAFKWDESFNLSPQDFENCVELKKLVNKYYLGKNKCDMNVNSRSQDIHSSMPSDEDEMNFSLLDGSENIRKFGQNASGIWKKTRRRRKRRTCFVKLNDWISEINGMNVNINKVNKRTQTSRPLVDSSNSPTVSRRQISKGSTIIGEDFSSTTLFDFSFVKKKRSSRSAVRRRISLPLISPQAEANIESNVEAEANPLKCTNVEGCYPIPDPVLQISCLEDDMPNISTNLVMPDSLKSENDVDTHFQNGPEDASSKPLIDVINQEVGTPLIGNLDLQKMVLYQDKSLALVKDKEKKPRAEVDLDPDIIETWRLLTENGERTPDEVKESEKLRKLREVFRGRAEAFIATMREFLGNRHFTLWKGSVIDSLVGTFLTQNVSDHLSSSAFMSLRARYPPKHKRHAKHDTEEQTCINSSVQKFIGVREQSSDSNSELSDVCETKPPTESLSAACKTGPHDLKKRDILRDTLQVEVNSFLEQYCDHPQEEVPTDLVKKPPSSVSLEEVVDKNLITEKKLGAKARKVKEEPQPVDWDQLRKTYSTRSRDSTSNNLDSVDWEAVRKASVEDIEATIQKRGQQRLLSKRIKELLERLVKDHGSTDLEWLRDVPPDKAKEFLLSINGLGLKSVECIRLLSLHHKAFPVDTNVARIAVRLGWVPLKPLPKDIHFHVLSEYPPMDQIQKYLWPALCTLDQETLYEFHYQLITFGKVFCPKISPNCSACPKKAECKHKASKDASDRLLLPGPEGRSTVNNRASIAQPLPDRNFQESVYGSIGDEPIVEYPSSPELEPNETPSGEAEVPLFSSEDDEMHFINLNNMFDFSRNLQDHSDEIDYSRPLISLSHDEALKLETKFKHLNKLEETQVRDIEDLPFDAKQEERDHRMTPYNFRRSFLKHLQATKRSQALVAIPPEQASKPNPKLKYAERLRTEHQVYELPDGHPVLENLNKREADDPSPYLFAIFRMGEGSNSTEQLRQRGKPEEVEQTQPPTFTIPDIPEVQDQLGQTGKPQEVDLYQPPTCTNTDIPEVQEQLGQTGKQQEVDLYRPPTFTKSAIPEVQGHDMVHGTILHPCKTALEGNFPLNGTYFQVNEVFVDFASSQSLLGVPRSLLWNLPRRTLYCGTSASSIIKGSSEEGVKSCFNEGFICVRGFVNDTGAPRHLPDRFHHMPLNKDRKPDEWWG